MRHPLEAIPEGRRRRLFLPLLALLVLVGVALARIDQPLRTREAPNGIVSFEVAGDVATAQRIIASWSDVARIDAGLSLGIDYLFLVVYSTLNAVACLWAAGVLHARRLPLASLGRPLAWGQWLAGALDATENWALATMLLAAAAPPWPAVAWWCAVPKFILTAAALAYAGAGAVARLARAPVPA